MIINDFRWRKICNNLSFISVKNGFKIFYIYSQIWIYLELLIDIRVIPKNNKENKVKGENYHVY